MAPYYKRYTMFKVAKQEDINTILKQYDVLRKTAVKNGKPYILYNEAKQIQNTDEPVHEGYTICSLTLFASKEDHDYYDKECAAHQELRKVTAPKRTGVCVTVSETDLGPKL